MLTAAAAQQLRADSTRLLDATDAGMLRVLTRTAPCIRCDDIGEVSGLDGEWRGYCDCAAGEAMRAGAEPLRRHSEDDDTCTCEACDGEGRISVGEFGGDCAAIHGMGGRLPDPPGWERCEACDGTGRVAA